MATELEWSLRYIFEKKSYRRVLITQDAIYLPISINV